MDRVEVQQKLRRRNRVHIPLHDAPPPLPDRIEADWSDGEPPPAGTVLSFRVSGEEVHPV